MGRDHPRGCGAHTTEFHRHALWLGSSPRVRGSPAEDTFKVSSGGIIPAGAGLTQYDEFPETLSWDHPRGCGAHNPITSRLKPSRGSSPRVRGSPLSQKVLTFAPGIIPAGAGLTMAFVFHRVGNRDHPRGCGAHAQQGRQHHHRAGSSPRVRGSLIACGIVLILAGIIPAGAGLTRATRSAMAASGDHPRGCGAHGVRLMYDMSWPGSSPRVRGSLEITEAEKTRLGIIPAGAGLTDPDCTS